MIEIRTETFVPAEVPSDYAVTNDRTEGSVEVTFNGVTRRVICLAPDAKSAVWVIYGLCARYATGKKVWPASVLVVGSNAIGIFAGFESRSSRHSRPTLVGFLQDAREQHISKR